MELMDYLTTRRSIRRYQDRPIPTEVMEELIRIATLAPTGSGEQPWGFLLLDDKEEIDALSETIKEWLKENLEQYPWLARYEKWYTNPKFHVFNRANAVLLIYGNTQSHWYVYDGTLAASQVMAAGAEQGIGCCWIGFAQDFCNTPSFKQDHGVLPGYELVAALSMGYAEEHPKPPERKPAVMFGENKAK